MKIIFGLMILSLTGLSGCAALSKKLIEKPKVEIERVNLKDLDGKGATLVFVLNVFNPNAFPLEVDALKYHVEVDGKGLSDGQMAKPAKIAAKSEATVDLPVPIRFEDLLSSALDFALRGKSLYRITGHAQFGLLKVPFDKSGELSFKK